MLDKLIKLTEENVSLFDPTQVPRQFRSIIIEANKFSDGLRSVSLSQNRIVPECATASAVRSSHRTTCGLTAAGGVAEHSHDLLPHPINDMSSERPRQPAAQRL